MSFSWLWLPLLALLGADDVAPFGFKGIELYKVDKQVQNLVCADFNADGRLDFALANNSRSRIEIFLQKTSADAEKAGKKPAQYDDVNEIHDDARFTKVLIPLESTIHAMVAADLDADGQPEIAVRAVPSRVAVWKHKKGKGERWEIVQKFKIKQGNGPRRSLLAADLNDDKRIDLALLEKERVSIFLQNDAGRLKPPEHFPTALRDGSGLQLVRPRTGPPTLVLYRLGNENGVAIRPLLGGSLGPEWIFRSGKMKTVYFPSGEENLSVLTVMSVSNRLHHKVIRKKSNQDVVLETPMALYPVTAERGIKQRSIAVGDVDGDGLADVVVSRPSSSTLNVYLQGKDGFFRAPTTSSTFADSAGAQVGDFNGDGKTDVLVISAEEQVVGYATWENDRLSFPHSIEGIVGKPHAAIAVPFTDSGRLDLAVVTENKRKYSLSVFSGFSGKPIQTELKFLKNKPVRLLVIDIDADGDKDLAVITAREEFGLVLNEGEGKFTPLGAEAVGGKWLLKDVAPSSYTTARMADGREAILVAKKTIGRAVGLDKNRKLVILEQINAGENTKLTAIARTGQETVVVDEKSISLLVLRNEGGDWKRVQEIELPSSVIRSVQAVALRPGDGPKDLIIAEKSGFLIVRRGAKETHLESAWSYESDVKDARLWRIVQGDLNADGQPDLAITDHEKRAFELLVPPEKPGEKVVRALRFEIFEKKRKYRQRGNYVREMVVADLTGDKKDDLLFLLHDRVVLYPQE